MIARLLQQLIEAWRRLLPREQRLGAVVAVLCLIMVCVMTGRKARNTISDLDRSIAQMQDAILNYTYQIGVKEGVERQYGGVAAQHSSAWSEAEIHDRLGQEIHRLAQKVPPQLDEDGIPYSTTTNELLVKIPSLQQGTLSDGGKGYREYRLSFQVPNTESQPVLDFIERLQGSPQSLRIDGLELMRSPLGTKVTANIDVARVIVDGAPEEVEASENHGARPTLAQEMDLADWHAQGGALSLVKEQLTKAENALRFETAGEGAEAYLVRSLPSHATYDVYVDLTSMGDGLIGVAQDRDGVTLPDTEPLRNDGKPYRYHFQFTAPGDPGNRVRLRAPYIQVESPSSKIYVSHLVFRKRTE